VIEARGLSERFGHVVAVDDLSFDVRPGTVTGFLGPNGSGKSTTMRMIMGLDYHASLQAGRRRNSTTSDGLQRRGLPPASGRAGFRSATRYARPGWSMLRGAWSARVQLASTS
jgi:ABC-type hemin transport system ATPase subunit